MIFSKNNKKYRVLEIVAYLENSEILTEMQLVVSKI